MEQYSDCQTRGVRISAKAYYINEKSEAGSGKYFFAYRISITNESNTPVTLLNRRWLIINSEGDEKEVVGSGVVGKQPRLKPLESFEYISSSMIDTEWGSMEGHFEFMLDSGDRFKAEIGRFFLTTAQATELSEL